MNKNLLQQHTFVFLFCKNIWICILYFLCTRQQICPILLYVLFRFHRTSLNGMFRQDFCFLCEETLMKAKCHPLTIDFCQSQKAILESLLCHNVINFFKKYTKLRNSCLIIFSFEDKMESSSGCHYHTYFVSMAALIHFEIALQWTTEPGKYRAYRAETARYYYQAEPSNTEPSLTEYLH